MIMDIPMAEVMSSMTIELRATGVKRMRFRLWLGAKIIAIAAFVMGCNLELEVRDVRS